MESKDFPESAKPFPGLAQDLFYNFQPPQVKPVLLVRCNPDFPQVFPNFPQIDQTSLQCFLEKQIGLFLQLIHKTFQKIFCKRHRDMRPRENKHNIQLVLREEQKLFWRRAVVGQQANKRYIVRQLTLAFSCSYTFMSSCKSYQLILEQKVAITWHAAGCLEKKGCQTKPLA